MKNITIIIPFLNEEGNIVALYEALTHVAARVPQHQFKYLFVNDGSTDKSAERIEILAARDPNVKYLEFSRNFGKEAATSAGLHATSADCAIMIDADLQHPPEVIPEFIRRWEKGAEVVTGVRRTNDTASVFKKIGSRVFYKVMSFVSDTPIVPGETDFRLMDRAVIDAFKHLSERQRMTRALINWLGFRKEYVWFTASERFSGDAQYSSARLIKLGVTSFVSHSLMPLRLTGYLGVLITIGALGTGIFVFVERYVLHDPFHWGVTGSAQLAIINVFLVGVILSALGLIALYIENIKVEVTARPLYVLRKSIGVSKEKDIV